MATILYCKNKEKKTVKVWTILHEPEENKRTFVKNAPHMFGTGGVLANLGFKAYATQREVFTKSGRKQIKYDMLELFEKFPNAIIVIIDHEVGGKYTSLAADWVSSGLVKDYGDGDQIFLDIKFMQFTDLSSW